MDRAPEIDARHRGALPERGLCGELVAADRRDAEVRQVAYRAGEAGRRDDVVDLEDELGRALGLARVDEKRVAAPLDALNRRVQHDDAAREDVIFVGLHVPCAHADEGAGVDRELCR